MIVVPYQTLLGIEVVSAGGDTSVVRLRDRPDLHNSRGHVHGGAIASMLDTAVGTASAFVAEGRLPTATINLMVTYLEPAIGDLTATAKVMRRGSRVVSVEAHVTDRDGKVCAHAVGTLRCLSSTPIAGPFVVSETETA